MGNLKLLQGEELLRYPLKNSTPSIGQGMLSDEVFLLRKSIFLILRFDLVFK